MRTSEKLDRRALVVINPVAGPGRTGFVGACAELASSVLASHGIAAIVKVTTGPEDAHRFACAGLADGVGLLIAWGGDGTVNAVASAMIGTPFPLAIIPGGSGNGLARDLKIPMSARAAFEVAATGRVRTIDAGELHGNLFFNVAGIGLDARIAERLAAPGARRGLLGYVLATAAEFCVHQPGVYSIHNASDTAGQARLVDITGHRALLIAVANSRQYGNGAQIAPAALLDDGLMEIVVIEAQSALKIALRLPALFRGTLRDGPGVLMRSAASIDISSSHPIHFHVDGEPRTGPASIRLQTRRQALHITGGD